MPLWKKKAAANPRPWDAGRPILDLLRDWEGTRPLALPDEAARSDDKVRFASGAWDGILTHHMAASGEHDEARHVHRALDALRRLIRSGDDEARESPIAPSSTSPSLPTTMRWSKRWRASRPLDPMTCARTPAGWSGRRGTGSR